MLASLGSDIVVPNEWAVHPTKALTYIEAGKIHTTAPITHRYKPDGVIKIAVRSSITSRPWSERTLATKSSAAFEQEDGSLIVHVRKQYNDKADVTEYFQ